jgi:hypothetical protein
MGNLGKTHRAVIDWENPKTYLQCQDGGATVQGLAEQRWVLDISGNLTVRSQGMYEAVAGGQFC